MVRTVYVRARLASLLLLAGSALVYGGGCKENTFYNPQRDATPDTAVDGPGGNPFVDGPPVADMPTSLRLFPQDPTLTVQTGQATPTVHFKVYLGSKQVSAKWTLDQGELGGIDASGVFKPAATVGGKVTVTATAGNLTGSTTVTVLLKLSQNGLTKANGNPGPGGFGGVGGEGLGPAVSAPVKTLLDGPPTGTGLKLLYPYDKTVWPLGILAPLIQWSEPNYGSGDGVLIQLSSSYFSYSGYFGRPSALPSGSRLVRHPIPQDVWTSATRSAPGGKLTLTVKVASGGRTYGPLTQTWTVARGRLRGTVYYQSYGTNLAKNYSGALGFPGGMFGGATLAIKGGSTDPTLVAGKSGGRADCRVCHSVSADGTRMVVQHGDNYRRSSSYNLLSGYAETVYPSSTDGKLGWVGMTPDGKLGLGNAVPIPGGANTGNTALYDMTTGASLSAPGLSSFVSRAGFPMFSPDGNLVAFTFYAGTGDATIGAGDPSKLVLMNFDKTTRTFSKPRLLYQGSGGQRPGWPAFWPTSNALLFELELPGKTTEYFGTRNGGMGELHWVDLATNKSYPLYRLNGKEGGKPYLPAGTGNHNDDTVLQYEPTISPIASGGYAWVVFMSRRMYGNVATIDPWHSDPRYNDISKNPTPKKLWVAALDLNPKPGADPSHPAFYLPAQELLAGNSRGFWVLDPCKPDGAPCTGGDECCNGYCNHHPQTGKLVCGKFKPGCVKEYGKCTQSLDCCDYPKIICINGRCQRWKVE
jgi:hypothetical protein